jgi:hypothetical protein
MRVRPPAVLLATLLLVPVACSRDDDNGAAGKAAGEKTTTTAKSSGPLTDIPFRLTAVESISGGGSSKVGKGTRDRIADTVRDYVERATTEPLRTGKRARAFGALFSGVARKTAKRDRAKLVDEGLPKTQLTRGSRALAHVAVLITRDGKPSVASVKLDVRARGRTKDGTPVAVTRRAGLSLVRDAGAWRIDSYVVHVDRRVGPPPKPKPKEPAAKPKPTTKTTKPKATTKRTTTTTRRRS